MSKLILSLDGGGIRGAATTQFLCKVEQKLQTHGTTIRDCVDFYAGTSTGSIIALALATTDMSIADINELYSYETAQKMFTENKGWLEIDGINAPKYDGKDKTQLLQQKFKQATLGNVPTGKHVLAVAYAIEQRSPLIIKSSNAACRTLLSSDVADASSAAPTYFPTKELAFPPSQEEEWLIDGGVIANNPAMCAIAEARRCWQAHSISDLRMLSIGTGFMTRKINGAASQKWGAAQWMTKGKILDILSDERVVAYQGITLMDKGSYIRVNANLIKQPGLATPPDDDMDDVSRKNIKRLKLLGDFWFEQYGNAVVNLLLNDYQGPSLDRIDPETGKPIEQSHIP